MSTTTSTSYEATVIFNTRGYEEPVETLFDKIVGILNELGAETGEVDNLGRRDFAYVTNRHHTGDHYIRVPFKGDTEVPARLQERIRLDKTVKRVLVERV